MDARLIRLTAVFGLMLSLTACSGGGSAQIDQEEKSRILSQSAVLQKKGYCLPNPILDEDDIAPLVGDGYKLSPADQYCLPEIDGSFIPGDYNCVPYKFVDAYDLVYLNNNGYHDTGTEYCNNEEPSGNTSGGSTTDGSTSGSTSDGSTSGSTTDGSSSGGNTTDGSTSGSTTDGSSSGGNVTGGSTTDGNSSGSNSGGSTTDGSTSGSTSSSSSGGNTTDGSSSGGTSGSTSSGNNSGSNSGGNTTDGSTSGSTSSSSSGGNTTDGSSSGGTSGNTSGSTNSGNNSGGSNNGGSNSGGSNSGGSNSGGSNNGGSTNGCDDDDDNSGDGDPTWNTPIDRMCSQLRTSKGKYKLVNRKELVVQVLHRSYDSKTKKYSLDMVCELKDTAKIKKDIVEKKRLNIQDCDLKKYKKSDLFVTVFSPVVAADLPISSSDYNTIRFFKKGSGAYGKDELSFVVYGERLNRYAPLSEKITLVIEDNPNMNKKVDPKICDTKASPLIVHVNPEQDVAEYVKLTSPQDGIRFDILGLNAEPKAHATKRISWLEGKQYMFLVKPDKNGMVKGVDEMFGDNTMGPDKGFAANGFLALAKYDKNADGVIDESDEVFYALRLWNDKNRDGIGQASEMVKLSKAKVKVIDLGYDASFRETDKYGNETVYKSVIKYNNGSLDLIFDLWFNYQD